MIRFDLMLSSAAVTVLATVVAVAAVATGTTVTAVTAVTACSFHPYLYSDGNNSYRIETVSLISILQLFTVIW